MTKKEAVTIMSYVSFQCPSTELMEVQCSGVGASFS